MSSVPTSSTVGDDSTLRRRNETSYAENSLDPITTAHRLSLHHIKGDIKKQTVHEVYDPLQKDEDTISAHGAPEQWIDKHTQSFKEAMKNRSCMDWAETFLPMVSWLKVYDWRRNFFTDLMAGLTVGVMIVPQSMSYAKLAGLPVEYGLYSSLVPVYVYAIFGSSRQLGVGPVALVSLLLNTGLTLILEKEGITPETAENYGEIYGKLAIQISFLVGICYIIMGVLRLGFITIFLSHAVTSGFTSAAAIIIGLSQIKYIFGYSIPSDKGLHKVLKNIFVSIDKFNYKTFLLGTFSIGFLMGMKKLAQKDKKKFGWTRAAAPLLLTVITIVLQVTVDLEANGIPIVGSIPKGLPPFSGGKAVDIEDFSQIAVLVFSIVIVGFMESIAIAKQLANKHNYEIDSSRELLGLGMSNLCAGLFNGYPITGSFSRSAVNNEAGAKSGISAIVTATLVLLVLLFLTPVFALLTNATLASIVISGVISLVDYEEAIYLWKVHKFDFSNWMFAFLGTLFLGVELGLGIAVGLSLMLVVFESAYPHTAVLGRLPGTTEYRNIKNYPQAERYNGIVVVRIDAPIYFANTQNIREKVFKYEKKAIAEILEKNTEKQEELLEKGETGSSVNPESVIKYIIIELSAVAHVDTSALHILQDMHKNYYSRRIQLCLTNPNQRVMQRLVSSGLANEIGREYIFVSTHDAVDYCLTEMDNEELMSRHHGSQDNLDMLDDEDFPAVVNISKNGIENETDQSSGDSPQ